MAKVLLVEDNEMNRDILSRRLSRRGYVVVFAMDGLQGVDPIRPRQVIDERVVSKPEPRIELQGSSKIPLRAR